uniref:Large ribosomal subunit protein mL52 n=1 Tax=Clytia hemisphaerica TaxID=252671 RepID=A0A7M5XCM9_9CNID
MSLKLFRPTNALQNFIASQCRLLSNSSALLAGGKSRVLRGQAEDATSYGPLTDLPDWTYVDERPVTLTKRQMKRQMRRVKIGADIAILLKEIDEQKVEHGKYGTLEEQHRDY